MKFTDEHKRKLSEAQRKSWTPERKAKLAESFRGAGNPFYGKHHKKRIGLSGELNPFFGRKHNPETKAKLRAANLGKNNLKTRYGISDEDYAAHVAAGDRWCKGCTKFVSDSRSGDKRGVIRRGYCRDCDWASRFKRKYKLDPSWYQEKLAEQDGGCAICGSTILVTRKTKFEADHDHKTGRLRGLLCTLCNSALSRVEDVQDWHAKALAYLQKYSC